MSKKIGFLILIFLFNFNSSAYSSEIYDATMDMCQQMSLLPLQKLTQYLNYKLSPSIKFNKVVLKSLIDRPLSENLWNSSLTHSSEHYNNIMGNVEFLKALEDCESYEQSFHLKLIQQKGIFSSEKSLRGLIFEYIDSYEKWGNVIAFGDQVTAFILADFTVLKGLALWLPAKLTKVLNYSITALTLYSMFALMLKKYKLDAEEKKCSVNENEKNEQSECIKKVFSKISEKLGPPNQFREAGIKFINNEIAQLDKKLLTLSPDSIEFRNNMKNRDAFINAISQLEQLNFKDTEIE